MDSFNLIYENHSKTKFPNQNMRFLPKSYSRDGRNPNEIKMKQFEIKLPNFKHVKIR